MFRRLNKKLELSGYNTFCIFFVNIWYYLLDDAIQIERNYTFIKIINVYLHWLQFLHEFIITTDCTLIGKYFFLPFLLFISHEIWPQTQLQLHVYIIIGMWHRDKHWVIFLVLTLYNYSGKVNNYVNYKNSLRSTYTITYLYMRYNFNIFEP